MTRASLSLFAVVVAVATCGCTRREVVRADPTSQTSATPTPAPLPIAKDVTRTHGDIEARIYLRSAHVVVGEPIVAVVDVHSTKGRWTVSVGGDQRNVAGYPTRIAMRGLDAQGAVVCDSVDDPALPNRGGLCFDRNLEEGEPLREPAVLNPMCPGLSKPGNYRVILHRRFAHRGMDVKKAGNPHPLGCDEFPLHEGPLPKEGYEPLCAPQMDALPWVTSELSLTVEPFDAAKLRVAVDARWNESTGMSWGDDTDWRVQNWVCGWLSCGCPKPGPTGVLSISDTLAALPSALPKSFPERCP